MLVMYIFDQEIKKCPIIQKDKNCEEVSLYIPLLTKLLPWDGIKYEISLGVNKSSLLIPKCKKNLNPFGVGGG